MDFELPAEAEAFRKEVKQFLAEELPDWWRGLAARGFSFESDHYYSERAKAFELSFGSVGFHRERIAVAPGL